MKTACKLTLVSPSPESSSLESRISALSFSPNGGYIAIANASKVVSIYTVKGERIDQFSLKANTSVPHKRLSVLSLRFCPDNRHQKIAIAQSDFLVSIFKWGSTVEPDQVKKHGFTGKKSICNRFSELSSVMHLLWPKERPHEIIYGLFNGTIKKGCLKSNKSQILYREESPVLAMASHFCGEGVISAHSNGCILVYSFQDEKQDSSCVKIAHHSNMINTISWGRSICVGGPQGMLSFYNQYGKEEMIYGHHDDNDEFSYSYSLTDIYTISFNASGDCAAMGSYNCFYIYKWNEDTKVWEQKSFEKVNHVLRITTIQWSGDGSMLAIGTSSGLVNLYSIYLRRYIYNTDFDVTHVTDNQIIVRNRLNSACSPILLHASGSKKITHFKIYPEPGRDNNRYIVVHTDTSILICDTDPATQLISEIGWQENSHKERYLFDAINACMISFAGELSVVELGSNKILGTVRTEYISSHLLSLRINSHKYALYDEKSEKTHIVKKIACLLDQQTIFIQDFLTSSTTTFNHNVHIDFLELNMKGDLLIFRDKNANLHLFDISLQTRKTLLTSCYYAQWVPDSDVIVAQRCQKMFVWYDAQSFDKFSTKEIDGKIYDIERLRGKTEVLTASTSRTFSYILSEDLIRFRYALDDERFELAANILESIHTSPHLETMWRQLFDESLKNWDLSVAGRCSVAFGDMSKAKYLRALTKITKRLQTNGVSVTSLWNVQVLMCKLKRNLKDAEDIYISHHKIREAIEMYEDIGRLSDALRLIKKYEIPNLESKKEQYLNMLLKTGQERNAAKITYIYGDCVRAMHLYLNARLPGKAASILFENKITQPIQLLQSICSALKECGSDKKAGDIYQGLGQTEDALTCYLESKSYIDAVELARVHFPSQVTSLEDKWGDYLVSIGDHYASVKHFLEAHKYSKALNSAIKANKWEDAADIAEKMNSAPTDNSFELLANHFQESGNLEKAEIFHLKAQQFVRLMKMFFKKECLNDARRISSYLSETEKYNLYVEEAELMEANGKFKSAENLLIEVNEYDKAIEMFIRHKHFEQAIKIASTCPKKCLNETYKSIALCLEKEGNLSEAEKYFRAAGDSSLITEMYRKNNLWDEAIHAANISGDKNESRRVAYYYAIFLGSSASIILYNLSLLNQATEYALSVNDFNIAYELVKSAKSVIKVEEVHFRKASYLESRGNYKEAETLYIEMGKPRKAVSMYKSFNLYDDAKRVIRTYLPHLREEETLLESSKENNIEHYMDECLKIVRLHEKDNRVINKIRCSLSQLFDSTGDSEAMKKILTELVSLAGFKDPEIKQGFFNVVRSQVSRLMMNKQIPETLTGTKCIKEELKEPSERNISLSVQSVKRSPPENVNHVEESITLRKKENGSSKHHSEVRSTRMTLDEFVKRKNWEGLWNSIRDTPHDHSKEQLEYYIRLQFENLKETKNLSELMSFVEILYNPVFPTFDLSIDFCIYLDLARIIFNLGKEEENEIDLVALTKKVKEILRQSSGLRVKDMLDVTKECTAATMNLGNLTMAIHYSHMMYLCEKFHLFDIAAKCAITLLQYCYFFDDNGTRINLIPADKAFHNAGFFCQKSDHQHLAFLFFNRYIDIIEAIHDNESENVISSNDFKSCILTNDDIVPSKNYVTSEVYQEQIRDWVLSKCMDSSLKRSLPALNEVVEGSIYSGLYKSIRLKCIITGYPIPVVNEVTKGDCKTNVQDWDEFVSKTQSNPWSGETILNL